MIHKIKKKEVPELLQLPQFWKQKVLPISRHKLTMLYQNPNAEDNDVLVYYHTNSQGEVVSTLTLVAAHLNDDVHTKIHFMSSWWSNGEIKGGGKELLEEALKDHDNKIISHFFLPATLSIYTKRGGFNFWATLNMYYINFNCKKSSNWKILDKVKRQFHRITHKEQSQIKQELAQPLQGFTIERMADVDPETESFLQSFWKQNVFQRENKEFSWMRSFPWILGSPLEEWEAPSAYYFKANEKRSEILFYKIKKQNEVIAFLVLSVLNNKVKLSYSYADEKWNDTVSDFMLAFAYNGGFTQIITTEEPIKNRLEESPYFVSTEVEERYTLAHESIPNTSIKNKKIHLGDGEIIMT